MENDTLQLREPVLLYPPLTSWLQLHQVVMLHTNKHKSPCSEEIMYNYYTDGQRNNDVYYVHNDIIRMLAGHPTAHPHHNRILHWYYM